MSDTPTVCPGARCESEAHVSRGVSYAISMHCRDCRPRVVLSEEEQRILVAIEAWMHTPTHLTGEQFSIVQQLVVILREHFPLDRLTGEQP
jgi:hypothetical protein